jgi:predicted nucleic acid-binding protein
MARYLLDTNVLIDLSHAREPATTWVRRHVRLGDALGISPVNLIELYSGIDPGEHTLWDQFMSALILWPIDFEAARRAGLNRYRFARKGIQLATTDVLVAAVAEVQQAVLVTSNVKDFPQASITVIRPDDSS